MYCVVFTGIDSNGSIVVKEQIDEGCHTDYIRYQIAKMQREFPSIVRVVVDIALPAK